MAESKHTPGPWHLSGTEIYAFHSTNYGKRNKWIASVSAGQGDKPTLEDYANTRLMATAPDLLKAAKEGLRYLEILFSSSDKFLRSTQDFEAAEEAKAIMQKDVDFICSAIQKAEGGE